MPIPKPNMNESKEDFLDRCMADEVMQEYDDKQRYAVCELQLETKKKIMDVKKYNLLLSEILKYGKEDLDLNLLLIKWSMYYE